jgi:hypothetical protein
VNVFISYRRSDAQDLAGRLADRLRAVPRIRKVFIDVDGIAPGTDFVQRLHAALGESDVCLLVIGPTWRGPRDGAPPRIFDGRDFVRLEAAAALASERKVLPVLANGAVMPEPDELPEELKGLSRIHALSMRHAYFDHDIELLIDALLSRRRPGQIGGYLRRHPLQAAALRALGGIVAAMALLVAGAAVHGALTGRSLEESLGGPAQVWLLITTLIAIGAAAALFGPRAGRDYSR